MMNRRYMLRATCLPLFFLAATMLSLRTTASAQARCEIAACPAISINISLPHYVLKVGEHIRLRILEAILADSVTLHNQGPALNYALTVRGLNVQDPRRIGPIEPVVRTTDRVETQGDEDQVSIDLSDLFDLTHPGYYSVVVSRFLRELGDYQSNQLIFRVVPTKE